MQSGLSIYKTVPSTQHNPTQQADIAATNAIIGSLANDFVALSAIALPVVVLCAIAAYRKHKARVLQQRIHRLNQIWQLDSSKNLF
jgi:hypothetical protein